MNNICVFCGSSPGSKPGYVEVARKLGEDLAENNIGLVYGGGSVGMMGVVAETVKKNGGRVTGVITQQLFDMGVAFTELDDLRIVNSMHERKALMAELSDGFIALPGGFGTMEEIFEIITWSQLEIHEKPCGLLNAESYYDKLMGFISHMTDEKFIKEEHKSIVLMDESPENLIRQFREYIPVKVDKAKWAKDLKVTE